MTTLDAPAMICRACKKFLDPENFATAPDGCPCPDHRFPGINHGRVPPEVCLCIVCDPEQTGQVRQKQRLVRGGFF